MKKISYGKFSNNFVIGFSKILGSRSEPDTLSTTITVSIIYLPRVLCLSFVLSYSCRPVIFLSSCHIPVIIAER
jgi:hypothetical protein